MRAISPAIAPEAAKVASWPSRSGSGWRTRGKYTAAFGPLVNAAAEAPATASATLVHAAGESITTTARRSVAYEIVSARTVASTSPVFVNGGITIRLTRSAFSSA